jgi:hypothetical protein
MRPYRTSTEIVPQLGSIEEPLHVSDIYDNMLVTGRMLNQLEADPNFRVETLGNQEAVIPIVAWRLWVRAPNELGNMEIVKGPHYDKSFITIADAIRRPRGYLFRIATRLICVTFSKDLDFDANMRYKMDTNRGEIYVYPAFIDDVGPFGQ